MATTVQPAFEAAQAPTSPDTPVPYTVTAAGVRAVAAPSAEPGHRLVPVLVGRSTEPGTVAYVPCPPWCVKHATDRVTDHVTSLVDVSHDGASAVLNLAADQVASVPTEVYLSWWPSADADNPAARACLAVDVDREIAVYSRTGALAVADQIAAFAENVRRLAETLPDDSPAAGLAPSAVTA
ncbi:DUF6907 domain-containing protein [Streptomyces sp. KN37]|uniref:DUF6907 domain-containing protein n=1 Tax=Streptomyces sp. KN37 TaxID=3090667 RepID=UPI002A7627F5|nr:hypothetical protein [Streptomyces sp. KN37]WPO70227.1 hypothetical protein R9806_06085 [Streptomyces sp. KN37]